MKIGAIVIHCHSFDRTVAFWQAALHYVPREPARGGWVVLRDPDGKGPNLSFQPRDRRPRSRSRIHLDLYTADQEAEVDRLLALGATRYRWRYPPGATSWCSRIPAAICFAWCPSRTPDRALKRRTTLRIVAEACVGSCATATGSSSPGGRSRAPYQAASR